ncbi:MAG: hypothetical protein QOF02_2045 [Blastocatellia bacterium]|jgi:hypothetical protein|nr:hypothetical protein [Blastocatellia bacterium]
MKIKSLCCVLAGLLVVFALSFEAESQTGRGKKQKRASVCFDPAAACPSAATFQAHDLPFRVPANAVIWESEPFYAVILQSVRFTDAECNTKFIPEAQRLEAQALFPNRKVFASRCGEPGTVFYSNVNPNSNFMAVYGGRTQAEAARMLASVKATGKFPQAYLRRMYAGFNGT